jgi:hypothetical protein
MNEATRKWLRLVLKKEQNPDVQAELVFQILGDDKK